MNSKFYSITRLGISLLILLLGCTHIFAQGGASQNQSKETKNKADQNLKSLARINPSTLAMEMNIPFAGYPGRNGNSLSLGINYSSKLWRMKSFLTYWYPQPYSGARQYVSWLRPSFAEQSAAGWTSSITIPVIEEKLEIYNQTGNLFSLGVDEDTLNANLATNSTIDSNDCTYPDPQWCWLMGSACNPTYCPPSCSICTGGGGGGGGGGSGGGSGGGGGGPINMPETMNYIKRVHVRMGSSSVEFRKSDAVYGYCTGGQNDGGNCEGTEPGYVDNVGIFLSVDGSGMKLKRDSTGSTLYMPNGSRYLFPVIGTGGDGESALYQATEYIDNDGNRTKFSETTTGGQTFNKIQSDTLGREMTDILPKYVVTQPQTEGVQEINLPGIEGQTPQHYELKWLHLKPVTGGIQEGALENQNEDIYYYGSYICNGAPEPSIYNIPPGGQIPPDIMFPNGGLGLRICNPGTTVQNAERFNPIVLAEVKLPNGKLYTFKYNQFGEITKIIYPTDSYETFRYDKVPPMNGYNLQGYDQTNRGVVERKVYRKAPNGGYVLEQRWQYAAAFNYNNYTNATYRVTTIAPKGDDPLGNGIKTEKYLLVDTRDEHNFGFTDPRAGMPKEEIAYDENNNIRSRNLTEWIVKGPVPTNDPLRAAHPNAKCDPRVKRTISVIIENGQALATLSETEYNETETTGNNAQADPEYFSHLDVKRAKGYHYAVIPLSTAQTGTLAQIAAYFNQNLLASVSETDYEYVSGYKDRGIHSLPVETRVLNPSNTTEIVAKTQTIYDNAIPASAANQANYPYSMETYGIGASFDCPTGGQPVACWQSPGSGALGRVTTKRLWDYDNNVWIETHTKYDIFGNAVKVKDAVGNEAETIFENTTQKPYLYAYPTKVITPAPDPTGTHGTSETSTAETTYDFMTGLVLETKNDFGQITKTEYIDSLLRPTRTYAVNFSAPEAQTVYDDNELWVKVRKQIDATNWDEAITYSDSLGRTVKTQAKDSQGDVFTETEYDFLGRVKRTTNPYRLPITTANPKLWSEPRYDEMGRAVESFAPAPEGQAGASLGITSYGISTAPGYVGTFVLTTDAAGKQSRAITNGLGQLLVVDEPDHTGAVSPLPQGTPNPSPTPTPTPGGGGGPRNCLVPENCPVNLIEGNYPNYSTFYKYNAQGKMVEVIQGGQHRYFLYDSLGRLIRVRQPEQEINAALNKTDAITGNNQWTAAFSYDLLGNVLTATDANGTVITNTYDRASRVTTKTYTPGQGVGATPPVEYYYDGKCNAAQTAACFPVQSPNYAKGKLTQVKSAVSETRYTEFDELGRLKRMEQRTPVTGETLLTAAALVSSYQYNFAGALIEETYPSGRVVKNEFEADGDLSRIYGKANTPNAIERTYANGFSYTPDGKIQRLRLGNGRWESAKFNERLQVTELALGTSNGDGSLWKLQYQYGEFAANGVDVDANKNTGNIAKQTLSFNGLPEPIVQTYRYDSLYRLKEARETKGVETASLTKPQVWKETFDYDRYGNRTSYQKFVGTTQIANNNQTFPSINPNDNRFNAGQGYEYDKNGNLLQDPGNGSGVRSYVFNGENKQKYVAQGGTALGEYFYDGEGKRVKKKSYDNFGNLKEETIFVYSAGKLVAEYSTAPLPTNPTTKWTVTDQLGSPRVITDSNGNVISRRDFMPFGEEIVNNLTLNERHPVGADLKYGAADGIRQKFTGYQKDDETGLDFAEARMYENRHGRFTAVDPLLASGKSANPQTFNRYVYCLNNPLKFIDPDGKIPVETVIDVVSLTSSFYDLIRNPSLATAAFFVWDAAATLIPYVPGSYVAKGLSYAQKATNALRKGGAQLSREATEWAAKIGSQGYRGLKAQGIVGRGLANNLEKWANNNYLKNGFALLSQGDDSTRRLLGFKDTTKAADFIGVSRGGTFIVGETKGYREIATGVEQLTTTVQGLYNKVSQQGSGFQAGAELIIEGTADVFNTVNREFGVSGSQLVKFVDGKAIPVTIEVLDRNRRVANIPVQVRFVQ